MTHASRIRAYGESLIALADAIDGTEAARSDFYENSRTVLDDLVGATVTVDDEPTPERYYLATDFEGDHWVLDRDNTDRSYLAMDRAHADEVLSKAREGDDWLRSEPPLRAYAPFTEVPA